MSQVANDWACAQQIDPHLKNTLRALADCHNKLTGRCFPSVAHITDKTGRSPRQERRNLAELERLGLIRRAFRGGLHGSVGDRKQRQRSTFYLLAMTESPGHPCPPGPVTDDRGTRSSTTAPELELELEEELEDEPTPAASADDMNYDEIWGSSAEREAQRQAEDMLADAQRDAKLKAERKLKLRVDKAQAQAEALASLPRSQWLPGMLTQHFKAMALDCGLARSPAINTLALNGGFGELLAKGHKPEDLANAIDRFFDERHRPSWFTSVQDQKVEIWRAFLAKATTLLPEPRRDESTRRRSGKEKYGW